jgi:hypothetical protein
MKTFLTCLIVVLTFNSVGQTNDYLKRLFYGTISKDDFLVSQKYSDVDSVRGTSYNPYIYNKRVEIVNWVWNTDFKQYHDTTKYYVSYELISSGSDIKLEYVEVFDRVTMDMIRSFSVSYLPNSNIITSVLDTDLDN